MALTHNELARITNAVTTSIQEEVPKAMRAEFVKIGLATEDADDQIDAQKDFAWMRRKRVEDERTSWLVRSRVIQWVLGVLGMLVVAGAGLALRGPQPPTVP